MLSKALIEEQQYREFVLKLLGVGLYTAAQIISIAIVVRTIDIFRD